MRAYGYLEEISLALAKNTQPSVPLARDFDSLNVSSAFVVLSDRIRR